MNLQPELDFITDLAYRAGRITLGYFNTGIRPDFKPDDTPVTAADRATEEFIRGEIQKKYPKDAILGEEFGESLPQSADESASVRLSASKSADESASIRLSADKSASTHRSVKGAISSRWLIDPIDGTKSFMRGVPLYGVLIGLEIKGEVRVGAAYYPALDEMLCAADGLGCWWNGRRAHVSEMADLSQAYVCFTNIRNMDRFGHGADWERINAAAFACRGWSDAYGYLLVATGRAEVMLDPVMHIWDCGPFPPIFREAGGYFGDWQGNPGHTHNEALACNQRIFPELMKLTSGENKS